MNSSGEHRAQSCEKKGKHKRAAPPCMLPGRTFQDVAVAEPHHVTCAGAKGRNKTQGCSIRCGTASMGMGMQAGAPGWIQ
eukprot:8304032-Pyramimonas_sp.AAC.2